MISTEHTSYLYALWTDDPAAGTAVIIGIDIDSDSMVDGFFSRPLVLDYLIDTALVDL